MVLNTLMLRLRKSFEHTACEWLFFGWIVLGLMVLCLPLLAGCGTGVDSANGANQAIPGNGKGHEYGLTNDPTVSLSPTGFASSANQGGSPPEAQTVAISKSGTGTLGWDVNTIAEWLSHPPVSDTDPASFTETADISELPAETDSTTITDTGAEANYVPEFIPEDLTISTSPPDPPTEPSTVSDALAWDPALNPDPVQNSEPPTASDALAWDPALNPDPAQN
jgi:hypothetical protein